MRKRRRNSASGKLVLGIYLMAIGVLLLASNFGFEVPHGVWNYWPFLLIAGGGARLAFGGDREAWGEGFWLLLSGLYCWISVWNVWGLSWGTAWPIFVIAGGLSLVFRGRLDVGGDCGPQRSDDTLNLENDKEADHVR